MGLSSECRLNDADWNFVIKLTRVAHVHVLSHQVTVYINKSNWDFGCRIGDGEKLIFPRNWSMQYVSIIKSKFEDNDMVQMTWEVLAEKEKEGVR
jgi:hypothetical protein